MQRRAGLDAPPVVAVATQGIGDPVSQVAGGIQQTLVLHAIGIAGKQIVAGIVGFRSHQSRPVFERSRACALRPPVPPARTTAPRAIRRPAPARHHRPWPPRAAARLAIAAGCLSAQTRCRSATSTWWPSTNPTGRAGVILSTIAAANTAPAAAALRQTPAFQ